jgi:integrase
VAPTAAVLTTRQWVERFKIEYMRTHSLKESTWHSHWWGVYKRLPLDDPLKANTLLSVVHKTEKETRNRKQTCEKLQKLADFAGVDVDLSRYAGSYSSSKVQPRDLPTDELISEWQEKVPNLAWRWVYGMLAAYGLRPHEAFFCQFLDDSSDRVIQVTEGKAKGRKVYPLYPEWVEKWELWKVNCPNVFGKNYKEYGNRTTRQFQRYEIPFPAYDLRHAYAIRASVVGSSRLIMLF